MFFLQNLGLWVHSGPPGIYIYIYICGAYAGPHPLQKVCRGTILVNNKNRRPYDYVLSQCMFMWCLCVYAMILHGVTMFHRFEYRVCRRGLMYGFTISMWLSYTGTLLFDDFIMRYAFVCRFRQTVISCLHRFTSS